MMRIFLGLTRGDSQQGNYFADLLVNDIVLVELRAVNIIAEEHGAQLLHYLKASKFEVGPLLNFGPKPSFRRKVFQTARPRTYPAQNSAFTSNQNKQEPAFSAKRPRNPRND
jgi:hypothetical protein